MSHFSTIKTQMVEATFLMGALSDLGYQAEQGRLSLGGFMAQQRPVDIKVRTSRWGYEIGFNRVGAHFEIVADWWGVRGVKRDAFVRTLTQRYAYRAARSKLEEQGFSVAGETIDADGGIRLVLRRLA